MAVSDQYLRIAFSGNEFLLPSGASFGIEQRESLIIDDTGDTGAVAWRVAGSVRWPAYCLGADLRPSSDGSWARAVFLDTRPLPLGLVASDIHLMPRADVTVEPYTPLGPPPSRDGHLFSGAWMRGDRVVLVFEPKVLIAYLRGLGGRT